MLLDLLLIALGTVALYLGGEILVRNVTVLAMALRVSPTVIGLTVVAFGTSAPELAAGVSAALRDSPGLVFGNVIGSNIANVGLILGITIVIAPLESEFGLARRELPFMLATSALLLPFVLRGHLGSVEGVILFGLFIVFAIMLLRGGRLPATDEQQGNLPLATLGTAVGLALLIAGADRLLVPSAVRLALDLGVSERLVGLTVVAFGTSVPELASCVVAASRRHHGLVLGNIVGSNIFNTLLILPAALVITPLQTSIQTEGIDLLVMLGFSLLLYGLVFSGVRLTRPIGVGLLLLYFAYMGWLVFSAGS